MVITVLYYVLSAYIAFIIIWNLIKSKKWQDEILYHSDTLYPASAPT